MNRRNFLRFSAATTAGGLIVPTAFAAQSMPGAGGLYYTKDQPGRWEKKAGGHLPVVSLQKDGANTMVEVITPHEMKMYEHYIVKHILLDADYQFITENMFNPETDKQARSEFKLEGYSGEIYALSVCNIHDTWLAMASV